MKIKTRLKLSFFTVAIVPMVLMGIIFKGLIMYQTRVIDSRYEIEGTSFSDMLNPVQIACNALNRIGSVINEAAAEDVYILESKEFQASLSEYLSTKSADAVIDKNGEFIFATEGISFNELRMVDPQSGGKVVFSEEGVYYVHDGGYTVKRLFFSDGGSNQYVVSIIIYIEEIAPRLKQFWLESVFGVVLVLIFISSIMMVEIYQHTIIPLGRLREATQNITNGNLDFEVEVSGNDEIDDLFRNFEAMRVKLKETANESIESEKKSKELVRNISHDLKTPLTAIKGYVEGLQDGIADTAQKKQRYLETIYKKAIEMDKLIDELTLYSKIDTNNIPYSFNRISACEFFGDCRDSLCVELEAKGVGFTYNNYLSPDVEIIADGEQLGRAINNIISNSLKYHSDRQLKIDLLVKDEGDFIRAELKDNGKGISKKDIPYIFDRMYRTDESRNSATGGSGIGLAIVKKIIEDHGGRIWAESVEGEGTTMVFILRKYVGGNNE